MPATFLPLFSLLLGFTCLSTGLPLVKDGKTLKIGFIGGGLTTGNASLVAVNVALDRINSNDNLLPGLSLEVISLFTADSSVAAETFQEWVEQESISFLVGPASSRIAGVVGAVALPLRTICMSHTATSTSLSIPVYKNLFRTIPNDADQCGALVSIAKFFGWKDVAILSATDSFSTGLATCALSELDVSGITVVNFETYQLGQSDSLTTNVLNNLRATGVRVFYFFADTSYINEFFIFADKIGFEITGPPYIWVFPETGIPAGRDAEGNPVQAVQRALVGSFATTQSPASASKEVDAINNALNEAGLPPITAPYMHYAYDAVYAFAHATTSLMQGGASVGDISFDDLRTELQNKTSFKGITGDLSFNSFGDRIGGGMEVLNWPKLGEVPVKWATYISPDLKKVSDPVFPSGSKTPPDTTPSVKKEVYSCDNKNTFEDVKGIIVFDDLNNDPNYIPADLECDGVVDCKNWSDEGFECTPSLAIAFIIFGFAALLAAVFIIVGTIYMNIRMDHRVMKAMGKFYLNILSACSLIGTLTVVTLFGQANDVTCQLRIWVLAICSSVIIGMMAAKQYRVLKIFSNKTMKPVVIRNKQLLPIIGAVVLPDLVVLTVWTAAFTYEADVDGDHLNCTSTFDTGFLLILFLYKGVLLVILSIMAFITRNFPSKFSESAQLAIAIYNTTIIGVILVPVIVALDLSWLQFLFACIFILAYFFCPWLIICVPKIYMVYFNVVENKSTTFEYTGDT